MYMTLGLTFLSLMSAYLCSNYVFNYKIDKLKFKGHLGRIPKDLSDQNVFGRFQS